MAKNDIAYKRAILFSARLRFSPEVQPVREAAIDKIVEQVLLLTNSEGGSTLQEIERQGAVSMRDSIPVINRRDLKAALNRLVTNGRVIQSTESAEARYLLANGVRDELLDTQRVSERRITSVACRLFRNTGNNQKIYKTAFLDCLTIIFTQLGEAYVRLLKGDIDHKDVLAMPSVQHAIRNTTDRYPELDGQIFETGIVNFFRDSHPDYDQIKWNLGQNHYIAKALGIDSTGQLLSSEFFGGATLYLDTNVLISALEPLARHYSSFQAFSGACRRLGINLRYCQISVVELQNVLDDQRELIARVADQIPEATAPKVQGVFFQVYHEHRAKTEDASFDFDVAFANFLSPTVILADDHHAELIDDLWFDKVAGEKETTTLVEKIQKETERRRGWAKPALPALHDALLLRWIDRERDETASDVWLVTLDNSLPEFTISDSDRPLAITLDALLQWISPLAFPEEGNENVAAAFSEAVRYQLLPQDNFFDLQDFLVFSDMEWSCKELPADDVEECIRHVKTKAPQLNPSNPTDREKIAHEISKFFADPGRKYKEDLERQEAEKLAQASEFQRRIEELESTLRQQQDTIEAMESEKEQRRRLRSARTKAGVIFFLWLLTEAGVIYLAGIYGDGENLLQRVSGFALYLALVTGGYALISIMIIKGEDRQLLGEPFRQVFGMSKP